MSATTQDFIHAFTAMSIRPSPEIVMEATAPALHLENLLRQQLVPQSHLDPYFGLIDVFDTSTQFRKFRPVVHREWDQRAHRLFSSPSQGARAAGNSSCVADYPTFLKNWELFTYGVLKGFSSWDNVVVAGGSVLACLAQTSAQTDRELHALYQSDAFSSADIDLFLWGLSPTEV